MRHRLAGLLLGTLLVVGALLRVPAALAEDAASEPPILRIETGMHGADINRLALADGGRALVTVSDDKTTRLWSLPSGAPQGVWRTPVGESDIGALYAVAVAGDVVALGGRTEAAGAKGSSLYIFDRRSGQMRGNIGGFPAAISALAFSADGKTLAVGLQGRGGLTVIDFAGHKLLGRDGLYGETIEWLAYAGDGRLATSAGDGKIRLYDPALKLLATTTLTPDAKERPWGLAFSPDGSRLAVGSLGSAKIRLFAGERLQAAKVLEGASGTSGALSVVAWSPDGAMLAAAGSYKDRTGAHVIRFWKAAGKDFAPGKDVAVAHDTVTDLALLADGHAVYASAEPSLGSIDGDGKVEFHHGSDHADFRDAWQEGFRVSRDGAIVEFPVQQGGKGRLRFDLLDGQLLADPAPDDGLKRAIVDDPQLKVTNWRNSAAPRLNGQPIALDGSERVRSIAVLPGDPSAGGVALGTDYYVRLERAAGEAWRTIVPSPAWSVDVSGDGRYVVAALGDGTIRWYDSDSGHERMSLFVDPRDRRWVAWIPEGFFDHSHEPGEPSGETLIGYHLNKGPSKPAEFVAIGQLYSRFYRRDLVLAKFRGTASGERSVAEQLAKTGDADAVLKTGLPPRAELIEACLRPAGAAACPDPTVKPSAPADRRFELTGGGELFARYRIAERGGGLGRVVVHRNGAVVEVPQAVESGDDKERVETVTVALGRGKEQIRLQTQSDSAAIQSREDEDLVFAVTPPPSPAAAPQVATSDAKLYVVAIGVSAYRQPEFRLANAANDASAVAELLQKPSPPVYGSAEAVTLLDQEATADNITKALEDVAAKARPQDIIVVFLSGHGESVDGKYYYAPVEFATGHPDELAAAKAADDAEQEKIVDQLFREEGYSEERLQPLLAKIQGNLLLVLDTCFSATLATSDTVSEKARNETVARSVGHETGRFILAGARSLALDSDGGGDANSSKHGLFTANLLKGLGGAGDLERVGRINVAELLMFTRRQVREESRKLNLDQEPSYYFQGNNFFDVRAVEGGQ